MLKPTLLIVFLFGLVMSAHGQTARRTMAVTFDDLPYVNFGEGTYIKNARAARRKLLTNSRRNNPSPTLVDVPGEQMVQKIVPARDG